MDSCERSDVLPVTVSRFPLAPFPHVILDAGVLIPCAHLDSGLEARYPSSQDDYWW
jgi:hypothetical protein